MMHGGYLPDFSRRMWRGCSGGGRDGCMKSKYILQRHKKSRVIVPARSFSIGPEVYLYKLLGMLIAAEHQFC